MICSDKYVTSKCIKKSHLYVIQALQKALKYYLIINQSGLNYWFINVTIIYWSFRLVIHHSFEIEEWIWRLVKFFFYGKFLGKKQTLWASPCYNFWQCFIIIHWSNLYISWSTFAKISKKWDQTIYCRNSNDSLFTFSGWQIFTWVMYCLTCLMYLVWKFKKWILKKYMC